MGRTTTREGRRRDGRETTAGERRRDRIRWQGYEKDKYGAEMEEGQDRDSSELR